MTAALLLVFVVVFAALHGFAGWRHSLKTPEGALALATVAALGASALISDASLRGYVTMGAIAMAITSVFVTLRLVYRDVKRPQA